MEGESRGITPGERFCRVYDFQKTERPPRCEALYYWKETLELWKERNTFPVNADWADHFGFEPYFSFSGGLGPGRVALSGPPVSKNLLKREGCVETWENDIGLVWQRNTDSVSIRWLRFPVESPRDWVEKIKPRLAPGAHDWGPLEKEAGALLKKPGRARMFVVAGLYAFLRNFWGVENLSYAFYDFPGTVHEMAEAWLGMLCECAPRALEEVPADVVFFHEDMAFKNGPLAGPRIFDCFMAPYYRELFSHLRGRGQKRFLLDSDGNNGVILDRFIQLGMNGLFPFECAAGYDIVEFRKKYPDFFIYGGLDKRILLKEKDDIRREVMEKVPAVWEMGGFVPSLDHSVPPCPQENFEYFLDCVRGLF